MHRPRRIPSAETGLDEVEGRICSSSFHRLAYRFRLCGVVPVDPCPNDVVLQYLELGAWAASRVGQVTVRFQSIRLLMYGFGEGNPFLNAFYKWIICSWEHVMAPDDDFVECRDRLESFDGFGFVVEVIVFSISSRLLSSRLIIHIRWLLRQWLLSRFRSNSCKDNSDRMVVRQRWECTYVT